MDCKPKNHQADEGDTMQVQTRRDYDYQANRRFDRVLRSSFPDPRRFHSSPFVITLGSVSVSRQPVAVRKNENRSHKRRSKQHRDDEHTTTGDQPIEQAKKMIILLKALQATVVATASLLLSTSMDLEQVGLTTAPVTPDTTVQLRPCAKDTNCVSSFYLEPPNRYVSPLLSRQSPNISFQRALRDLSRYNQARSIETKDGVYIHLTVPGTAPTSLDDIELFFQGDDSSEDGVTTIVNLRGEARVTLPPPPFCVRKNCINGSMDQRDRIARVKTLLGLPAADESRMKDEAKWTPIFFNSDKVPSWDE